MIGCNTYDLTGVNQNPRTKTEAGIYKFKEKWGGKLRTYNIYSKPSSSAIASLFKFIKKIHHRGSAVPACEVACMCIQKKSHRGGVAILANQRPEGDGWSRRIRQQKGEVYGINQIQGAVN